MAWNEEEFLKNEQELSLSIGRIAIKSESLNNLMRYVCDRLLKKKGLPKEYVDTVLAGMNVENMRRLWFSLCKLYFREHRRTSEVINQIDARIDSAIKRRNDAVHRHWLVGSFDVAPRFVKGFGGKTVREISPKAAGGTRTTVSDTAGFAKLLADFDELGTLLHIVEYGITSDVDIADHVHFQRAKIFPITTKPTAPKKARKPKRTSVASASASSVGSDP